jgi:hypothetical protein
MLRRERGNAGFLREGHVLFECDLSSLLILLCDELYIRERPRCFWHSAYLGKERRCTRSKRTSDLAMEEHYSKEFEMR